MDQILYLAFSCCDMLLCVAFWVGVIFVVYKMMTGGKGADALDDVASGAGAAIADTNFASSGPAAGGFDEDEDEAATVVAPSPGQKPAAATPPAAPPPPPRTSGQTIIAFDDDEDF